MEREVSGRFYFFWANCAELNSRLPVVLVHASLFPPPGMRVAQSGPVSPHRAVLLPRRTVWRRELAKGVCRTRTEETGAEYARVDYGTGARLSTVPRSLYDRHGYKPPFDELPPCD